MTENNESINDRALDEIEANPDECVGEEVEGEYDPDYDVESEVEA